MRASKNQRRSLLPLFLKSHFAFVILMLYGPLLVLSIYSFNSGSLALRWESFSLIWYQKALNDPDILLAIRNSLGIAFLSAIGATILGTALALGIERGSKRLSKGSEMLAYLPLLIPEIVLGLGLLLFISQFFRPLLIPLGLQLDSFSSVVLGHMTLAASYVLISVRSQLKQYNQQTEWAAFDLGASRSKVLTRIILPQLTPAIVSGFWMAFSLSLDDFYISYFVTVGGSGFKTVPLYLWSLQGRSALTPELNVVSVLMLGFSALGLLLAFLLSKSSTLSELRDVRSSN